jgi:hypothetical protein
MAQEEVAKGSNPDATAFAQKIITDHQAEITTMKGMLTGCNSRCGAHRPAIAAGAHPHQCRKPTTTGTAPWGYASKRRDRPGGMDTLDLSGDRRPNHRSVDRM